MDMLELTQLEKNLKNHPQIERRLRDTATSEAASAAIKFFVYGDASPKDSWLASETWRSYVMPVFREFAAVESPVWRVTENLDAATLHTGDVELCVGDLVEIRDEGSIRFVTYVMPRERKFFAAFKGQGAVPTGSLEWRLVASTYRWKATSGTSEQPAKVASRPNGTLMDTVKSHPAIAWMTFVGIVVIGLAAFTDALERIVSFIVKLVR